MRHTLTREYYLPKTHTHKINAKRAPAVVYLFDLHGGLAAKGFAGKAAKPSFFYTFKTPARRWQYIGEWLRSQDLSQQSRDARKAEKQAFVHSLKVGDILNTSWGYDQTNIEFFQVVRLVAKSMVIVRELAQDSEQTGFDSGSCVPVAGKFIGPELRKRVLEGNTLDIHNANFGRAHVYAQTEIVPGLKIGRTLSWSSGH